VGLRRPSEREKKGHQLRKRNKRRGRYREHVHSQTIAREGESASRAIRSLKGFLRGPKGGETEKRPKGGKDWNKLAELWSGITGKEVKKKKDHRQHRGRMSSFGRLNSSTDRPRKQLEGGNVKKDRRAEGGGHQGFKARVVSALTAA